MRRSEATGGTLSTSGSHRLQLLFAGKAVTPTAQSRAAYSLARYDLPVSSESGGRGGRGGGAEREVERESL